MRVALPALLFLTLPAVADDALDVAKAVEQAKGIAQALIDGDAAKVVDGSLPRLVELMGGREKMIEQTKAALTALKGQGVAIKSHTLGKPGEPVSDGGTAYLVIPTTLRLESEDSKVVAESYLLGVTSDGGKTWKFVDGAGMDQPGLKEQLFPRLPAGLKLPEKKEPVITKD